MQVFSEINAFCVNNFIFTTEFYFVLFWKYFGKCKGLVKQGGKKPQHLLRDKFKPPFRQNTKIFIQMLVPKTVWMTMLVEGKTHCTHLCFLLIAVCSQTKFYSWHLSKKGKTDLEDLIHFYVTFVVPILKLFDGAVFVFISLCWKSGENAQNCNI